MGRRRKREILMPTPRDDQRITQHLIQEALRDVHDEINALGGVPANDCERASNETVGKALAIIEAKMVEVGHGY